MHRLFRTLFKGSDPGDQALRKEREESKTPFFKSPFPEKNSEGLKGLILDSHSNSQHIEEDDSITTAPKHQVEVIAAHDVAWLDLLIELAMTTAFANLAENTEITTINGVASYAAFIALVWWIWASQVLYNMRFRQADWFHRICAVFLLLVFSAMAAFTHDFDITSNLLHDQDIKQLALNASQLTHSSSAINAQQARESSLPIINAKGIAVVMIISRVLLMAQYFVTLQHSRTRRHIPSKALAVHTGSLAISTLLYLISYPLIQDTKTSSALKIGLWYGALAIEIVAHFVANILPGHVNYSDEPVFERNSTAFIVILGVGLDKITSKFQFVVGTLGFGVQSIFSSISVAIILIAFFGLYFSTGQESHRGSHRSLSYFLFHFPFIASVLILLKGISSLLAFVNLAVATNLLFEDLRQPFLDSISKNGTLIASSYPSLTRDLLAMGLSTDDFVNQMNNITASIPSGTESNGFKLRLMMKLLTTLFNQFGVNIPPGSKHESMVTIFFEATELPTMQDYVRLYGDLLRFVMTPAAWFMGNAGITLILLGLLFVVRLTPRDKWEWGGVLSRIFGGIFFSCLTLFDIHYSDDLLTMSPEGVETRSDSLIWRFAMSGWILPSFALLLILINAVNWLLLYLARRSYPPRNDNPQVV